MASGKDSGLLDWLMNAVSVTALVSMLALIGLQSHRAIAKVAAAKAERYFEAMQAALTDVKARQMLHYLDAAEFADTPEELRLADTEGVAITLSRDGQGWAATASHVALGAQRGCAVFFGTESPVDAPARPTVPGEVACSE